MKTSFSSVKKVFSEFCQSPFYILAATAFVLCGHLWEVEFWLNIPLLLMLCAALCLCDSIKPFAFTNLVFIFQVTLTHSPSFPEYSSYYFAPDRLWIILILAVLVIVSLAWYLVRTGFFSHIRFKTCPMLLPLLILSAAFLCNGLFFEKYIPENFLIGVIQVTVYLVDFLVLWHGLSRETTKSIMDFAFWSAIAVTWILIVQLINVYFSSASLEELRKDDILFGWGISNTCGCILSLQFPLLFYRLFKGKNVAIASLSVVAAFVAITFTLARAALLCSAVVIVICFVYVFSCSTHRKSVLFTFLVMAVAIGMLAWAFQDRLSMVFDRYMTVGLGDNGRFRIWKAALSHVFDNPLFGIGFFGENVYNCFGTQLYVDFYPQSAHNTLIDVLDTCGMFGLASYLYMRFCSAKVFFKRPSAEKVFLGLTVLVFLGESLLDVFAFSIYPPFFYNFALAAAFAIDKNQRSDNLMLKSGKLTRTHRRGAHALRQKVTKGNRSV